MQTYRKVRKFEQTNSSLYIIATTLSAYDSINSSANGSVSKSVSGVSLQTS